MRRLTLRREALSELTAADLGAVLGASGTSCYPTLVCTQITTPTRCSPVCEVVQEILTDVRVTEACPETR